MKSFIGKKNNLELNPEPERKPVYWCQDMSDAFSYLGVGHNPKQLRSAQVAGEIVRAIAGQHTWYCSNLWDDKMRLFVIVVEGIFELGDVAQMEKTTKTYIIEWGWK